MQPRKWDKNILYETPPNPFHPPGSFPGTVMFVLDRIMRNADAGQRGCAMSFGPGLTAETMLFHAV